MDPGLIRPDEFIYSSGRQGLQGLVLVGKGPNGSGAVAFPADEGLAGAPGDGLGKGGFSVFDEDGFK
ncbi:hypothetical protein DSCA_59590 [Desulfosarcina alkanivorans]|uniref:Uncharacterized protein n=1 Tax=Desulfosarcina alkanivorans TaxID=571177 RepID=A0A5K7YVH0_9BACT|nr:hypothetical protein DSCA_59590 [Desulfosarcina alkanivorans]